MKRDFQNIKFKKFLRFVTIVGGSDHEIYHVSDKNVFYGSDMFLNRFQRYRVVPGYYVHDRTSCFLRRKFSFVSKSFQISYFAP